MLWPLPGSLTLTPTYPFTLVFLLLPQVGSLLHDLYTLFSLLRSLFPQLMNGRLFLIVGLSLSSNVTSERPFRTTQAPATLLCGLCHFLQSCDLLGLPHYIVTSPGQGVVAEFTAGTPALRVAPDTEGAQHEHAAARTSSAAEARSLHSGGPGCPVTIRRRKGSAPPGACSIIRGSLKVRCSSQHQKSETGRKHLGGGGGGWDLLQVS